ncbi:Methyltransferases isoform 2 [Theobroma cacao]|uniref:Alpha N-terminal protein methyltransferase 1 n=1 Tax=Theobroma cacao TaxID=3641 RepID=A0A061G913_THECC|nr:Methyltransferases isoform 2 [Theobroma cacao]
MEAAGFDSDGREFKNAQEMWREQIGEADEGENHKKTQWYSEGVAYWEGVEASVDGVLGGFGQVNEADIARESLSQEYFVSSDAHKATNFYCVSLQEFTPDAGRYNVIWIQWCIGHLTDDDFVSFFKRAKVGLKPGGFFVLKENIARNGFVLDKEDRSITRSDLYFKDLFRRCGLHLYKIKDQKGLPEELFAVKMYALTTEGPNKVLKTRSKAQANRPGIIK